MLGLKSCTIHLIFLLILLASGSSLSLSSNFAKFSKRLIESTSKVNENGELDKIVNETAQIISKAEDLLQHVSKFSQLARQKEVVFSDKAPKAIGPYSQGIKHGGILFTSGSIGINPATGKLISDELRDQVTQALKNLECVLAEGKSNWSKVMKVTIYTTDLQSFATINEIYGNVLKENQITQFPARTTIEASALPLGAKFEIDAIASYDE